MIRRELSRLRRIALFTVLILALTANGCLPSSIAGQPPPDETLSPSAENSTPPSQKNGQLAENDMETTFSASPGEIITVSTGPGVPGNDAGTDLSKKPGTGLSEGDREIRVIDPEKPMVALTFDDGPGPGTTAILDLLEQYDARATFFIIGERLEYPVQAEKLIRAAELGCVIGSHTYDHISFKKLNAGQIREQIDKTNEILIQYIGIPATLIRPPYGHLTEEAREAADSPYIHWSVDTNDWLTRDAQAVIEEVQENVQDGDIILMHDLYSSTAEACETLIPWLIEQGYQLVTVPEMMEAKGITMENGKMYKNGR
ncbi:MAG: polysaccharide deacetylase family protein [Lachnospiraceae bacterium]|jgi:peptidoglycan/xylan/chitin deacetylase (PgdA/CDA1 family)|nr:polysaccharide deacetylase family protein [Lachnospiraceae bacterium]